MTIILKRNIRIPIPFTVSTNKIPSNKHNQRNESYGKFRDPSEKFDEGISSWTAQINPEKIASLPQIIYGLSAILIKVQKYKDIF